MLAVKIIFINMNIKIDVMINVLMEQNHLKKIFIFVKKNAQKIYLMKILRHMNVFKIVIRYIYSIIYAN